MVLDQEKKIDLLESIGFQYHQYQFVLHRRYLHLQESELVNGVNADVVEEADSMSVVFDVMHDRVALKELLKQSSSRLNLTKDIFRGF